VPNTPTILFLDDCPDRTRAFLLREPSAITCMTARECIDHLKRQQTWEECHLDHDLTGESHCDSEREDCGMEVVRWVLCNRNYCDVQVFIVHTHFYEAGLKMAKALVAADFQAMYIPWGHRRVFLED
jgi:hypothetical protein